MVVFLGGKVNKKKALKRKNLKSAFPRPGRARKTGCVKSWGVSRSGAGGEGFLWVRRMCFLSSGCGVSAATRIRERGKFLSLRATVLHLSRPSTGPAFLRPLPRRPQQGEDAELVLLRLFSQFLRGFGRPQRDALQDRQAAGGQAEEADGAV